MIHPPLTLGTAGHIDHGKTALVRALTGVETDRLPQERERGISIELGYAPLELPNGHRLSVVDVPGHERFVRTMVAGATGIDLFLMTIAADDGVMPQTREHAAVLRALDVRRGVIAVTKSDLADPSRAVVQGRDLLPEAEVVAVSARTGEGLADLWGALERVAEDIPDGRVRCDGAPAAIRLHIDRVFTIRGAGTVITGTLWSGSVARDDRVVLLPQGLRARVRSVQVHDESVSRAAAGQRVALNLSGVRVAELSRGDVVVSPESTLRPTYVLDCELRFEDGWEPGPGARVQVHHGTRESPARSVWLGGHFWQLRLERPLIAADGDRLVVRRIAPADTVGGGRVLDGAARRHGPGRDLLAVLSARARLPSLGDAHGTAWPASPRRPVGRGVPASPSATESKPLSRSALDLADRLREAGLGAPPDSELDAADLAELRAAGVVNRVSRAQHLHTETLAQARDQIVALARSGGGQVTLAQVRDELCTSRRYAQALLEHLDSERVLIRRGEVHALRRAPRSP